MRFESSFRSFVRRAGDRRLERTAGSRAGLRLLFGAMASRFRPEAAEGFTGDIGYELRYADGRVAPWTVAVGERAASARPGRGAPVVTVRIGVADFVRVAAQELDAGAALLDGRMDVAGDFAVAMRLGAMFGRADAF